MGRPRIHAPSLNLIRHKMVMGISTFEELCEFLCLMPGIRIRNPDTHWVKSNEFNLGSNYQWPGGNTELPNLSGNSCYNGKYTLSDVHNGLIHNGQQS